MLSCLLFGRFVGSWSGSPVSQFPIGWQQYLGLMATFLSCRPWCLRHVRLLTTPNVLFGINTRYHQRAHNSPIICHQCFVFWKICRSEPQHGMILQLAWRIPFAISLCFNSVPADWTWAAVHKRRIFWLISCVISLKWRSKQCQIRISFILLLRLELPTRRPTSSLFLIVWRGPASIGFISQRTLACLGS